MTGSHNDEFDADAGDLAGEYVLGTLSADERRGVALALPHDPALRAAVAAWEARLLPLSGLAEPVQPSSGLWPRIEAALGSSRMPAPAATGSRWWDRLDVWRGLAAAGLAAAAILAVVPRLQTPEATPRYMVVLAAPGNMAPGWIVQAGAAGQLELVPLGSTAVPPDKSLQLWTKADGWKGPVSLGLVQPGKRAGVSVAALPPLQPNQLFEITLEPKSGSPLDRPTGPILYIGRAVRML
ncbi:anti-sigma factor domain-containing protein [Massilia sp. Leaf139]|uniref:anti-sigma factor n=1 Tax=Massilia sp. Leaf139 TaxID=1736272 RepID=UPI0006F430C8|nr:anti-sigma factor [Massilia sp. Leaf139]KQQ97497.1 RNA polymerase subunit sigma-70 [Massilia sp. Leaf139]